MHVRQEVVREIEREREGERKSKSFRFICD